MNRREFCIASGTAFVALADALHAQPSVGQAHQEKDLTWSTPALSLALVSRRGQVHQGVLLPSGFVGHHRANTDGPAVALQVTGDNAPDSGTKQAGGAPGLRLSYVDKVEHATPHGRQLILQQRDVGRSLVIETIYEAFDDVPVLRCRTHITNQGTEDVGIEYLSSAMLHGLGSGQRFDNELRIHYATNSWMSEAQWENVRPSLLGFSENERTSWSQAEATSIGTWSSEKYLPMAMVEDPSEDLVWFWQIEHNGSWHWQVSNSGGRGQRAEDVYAYLGGPDAIHAQAWKNLQPGAVYETVPVAMGCVTGGFEGAVQALTRYRRRYCVLPRQAREVCPVIFNDYMNCLSGDPNEQKELPLIDAAADLGCEYFVIDAGWYAEVNENWSLTVGAWEPSKTRWPHGLKYTLDYIRKKGMVPGLWLEPEVAGRNSPLASKPDSWFMMRHGKRFLHNSRLLLDFRNPDVRSYLDAVVDRCVIGYGAGYLKFDYNTTSLEGTESHAESPGQGLLEHNRAHLLWLEGLLSRHKELVIENCGSGGGRMDYAMLSRLQLQSVSDQEEYQRFPAILVGASAAVIPEQMAIWSYPLENATADAASYNMVNALLGRIHQSGHLARLAPAAKAQVRTALALYRQTLRPMLRSAVPSYPIGLPRISDHKAPICLAMKCDQGTLLAVWRQEGEAAVTLPRMQGNTRLLYPTDLGIGVNSTGDTLKVNLPREYMAALLMVSS